MNKDNAKSTIQGICIMLISGMLYSVLAALVKWGHMLGYSSAMTLFYRAAFQIIFAILTEIVSASFYTNTTRRTQKMTYANPVNSNPKIQLIHKNEQMNSTKLWIVILLRGVFGAAATFTYFESADLIPIGSAVTLISLSCITASFFGWFFLSDTITKYHIIALLLGLIGAILISQPSFIPIFGNSNDSNVHEFGYVVALISAIFGGLVYVTIRMAKKAPLFVLILSQGLSCVILSLVLIFFLKLDTFKWIYTKDEALCISLLGIVGFMAQWTLTMGAQRLIAGVSSLLRSSTNMICSFVLEIVIFNTYPNALTVVGALIGLSAVVLVSVEKIKATTQKSDDENNHYLSQGLVRCDELEDSLQSNKK